MDKVAASRAVAKLLKQERITREFADQDKRRSILNLSPAGREVYEQVVPMALKIEAELLEGFTGEEIDTLNLLVDRMLARMRMLGAPEV